MWKLWKTKYHNKSLLDDFWFKVQDCIQVNLCQKLLFLHQLTHNMMTYSSLNCKFNTWKFQAQTGWEHVVYRYCFWHSENFLYTTCSLHVLEIKRSFCQKFTCTYLAKHAHLSVKLYISFILTIMEQETDYKDLLGVI